MRGLEKRRIEGEKQDENQTERANGKMGALDRF